MTQDIGPEDQVAVGDNVADEDPSDQRKRVPAWQWLALAILLLLVLWLIWQYLESKSSERAAVVVTSSEVKVVPGGSGAVVPDAAGDVVTATSEVGPRVPDVVGMTKSAAVSAVEAEGYRASVTVVYGSTHPAGSVFQQNPTAGAALAAGETVGMLVQLRPSQKPMITVPQLVGLSEAAAKNKLEALGANVVLSYAPDARNPGKVKSQWPLAGDRAVKGGDVQIQITVKP